MIIGKNPSILEKWCVGSKGAGLNCLVVSEASSRAVNNPKAVTARAASLRAGGIVIIGVFKGKILEEIRRPAIMLPQAKRLIELSTAGLFSLRGENELNRGCPIQTKNTTRKL